MLETPELLWQNLVRESVREVRYGMRSEVPGIIRLVDHLLERAVALHASDIHLEPQEMRVRLRFRIDGILRETMTMPANLGPAVTSRIKVMAGMDIAVHQQPQDGHILFQPRGRRIDIRVSSLPASSGEVIVMRLMDVSAQLFSLDELGFSKKDTATLRELIHRPAGMIVLCGPMNSGKTSSLYAALTELNTESRNLVTLEDPIERILPGVNQVQIHPKAGMTFVAGLRGATSGCHGHPARRDTRRGDGGHGRAHRADGPSPDDDDPYGGRRLGALPHARDGHRAVSLSGDALGHRLAAARAQALPGLPRSVPRRRGL